jgi:hypothetical protein
MICAMRTWMAVLLLAACGHGAAKPTTPVAPSGATCDQVSQHLVTFLVARDASNADLTKKITGVFQERCTQDAWSSQARQCLVDAKEMKDADACQSTLTKAQLDAFGKAMEAALPTPTDGATPIPEVAAPPPPPAEAPPPPPDKKPPAKTRGAQKKSKPGGKTGRSGDPCEGGE